MPIRVNDNGNYSEATVNSFGPGVLPGLISYYDQPVNFGISTLPDGYTLNREYQVARPSYKSGVDITLKVRSAVAASGRLLQPDGVPVSLASGEVVRAADSDDPKHVPGAYVGTFFTNERGQYFIENLEPGAYELKFYDLRWKPVRIKVSKGRVGVVRMNPITLEKES
jgi:outer membrane usher protein